ncbi:MAG: Holliday junction resolvase RuvX [Candidatus Wallacebacter cryptica]|jgi:putative Holliday junction resolvase|nr:Holliday junction resolvase RuvX [Bacillota bacterium]
MRVLGLDVGEKTVGVAVSDPLGFTAQGLEVIRRTSIEQDLKRLAEIADQYQVERIVVGMPRRTDGSYGPEAEKVEAFAAKLKEAVTVPIVFWDERFSTAAAERILLEGDVSRAKRRRVVDKVAASVILQGYLDRN